MLSIPRDKTCTNAIASRARASSTCASYCSCVYHHHIFFIKRELRSIKNICMCIKNVKGEGEDMTQLLLLGKFEYSGGPIFKVLKKVFWTFSYLYLWHTMWFHAKKLLKALKFWKSLSSLWDLKFVKKFTRPNFRAKEFYTLKTRISRVFSPAINSENASLSVIWPSFG